jgi:hypothetical protein
LLISRPTFRRTLLEWARQLSSRVDAKLTVGPDTHGATFMTVKFIYDVFATVNGTRRH